MRTVAVLVLLVGVLRAQQAQVSPEPLGFREFTQQVREYMKLQKAMPQPRTTKDGKQIVERRHALALTIREARANARQGDIFTPAATEEFSRAIRATFQGANAPAVRKTIRQGEPVPDRKLSVNGDYPESLPLTTVPPTLMLRLPRLPSELAYGIIGHDFVLQDAEARVIVDFIPGALP